MKKCRLFVTVFLLLASGVAPSSLCAELIPFPLSEFARRSTLIIVGEVIKLEKADERPAFARGRNIYRATISIQEVIKGNVNEDRVIVDYYLFAEEPQFRMGKVFVFLFERHDRLRVFQGWYGVIPFKREAGYPDRLILGPIEIPGEAEYQRPEEFITRVRDLLAE